MKTIEVNVQSLHHGRKTNVCGCMYEIINWVGVPHDPLEKAAIKCKLSNYIYEVYH